MKTILIFEPYLQKGHKFDNNQIVSILSNKYKLLIPNPHNYYEVKSPNITYLNVPELNREGHGKYLTRIICFLNFILIRLSILCRKYDHILVMAYHTPHFKYQYRMMPNKPITIFEQFNIDRLSDKRERDAYFTFCNKVGHMVYATYLKEYLESIGVDKKNIYVIAHPVSMVDTKAPVLSKVIGYKHILCPGLSNDNELLKEIIEYEKKTHLLEENKIILTLRYDLGDMLLPKSINIMKGYLSAEDYDNLYKQSDGILVAYPPNYAYRFSGVILNSLCVHKVVFGNNIRIVQYFSANYPNNCRLYKTVEDLFSIIITDFVYDEKEFEILKEKHSEASVLKSFDLFLNK